MKTLTRKAVIAALDEALDSPDPLAAIAALRDSLARPAKRPGRPSGARTKALTPGMERSREFFALLVQGERSMAAAARVAMNHDKDPTQVFKEARRHDVRLTEELDATFQRIEPDLVQQQGAEWAAIKERIRQAVRALTAEDLAGVNVEQNPQALTKIALEKAAANLRKNPVGDVLQSEVFAQILLSIAARNA